MIRYGPLIIESLDILTNGVVLVPAHWTGLGVFPSQGCPDAAGMLSEPQEAWGSLIHKVLSVVFLCFGLFSLCCFICKPNNWGKDGS